MNLQELYHAQCQSKEHHSVVSLEARFAQETQQRQEQLKSFQTDSVSRIPKPRRWHLLFSHRVIPKFQCLRHPLPQLFPESRIWFIRLLKLWWTLCTHHRNQPPRQSPVLSLIPGHLVKLKIVA